MNHTTNNSMNNIIADIVFEVSPSSDDVIHYTVGTNVRLITDYGTNREAWMLDLDLYIMLRNNSTSRVKRLSNLMEEVIRRMELHHTKGESLPLVRLLRLFTVPGSSIDAYQAVMLDTGHLDEVPRFGKVLNKVAEFYLQAKSAA